MFDLDPRDHDARDDERHGLDRIRGSRDSADGVEADDDWRQPEDSRDRNGDVRTLGRGPGDDRASSHSENNARERGQDARWPDRDERDRDTRDAFTRHVDLPRGLHRELVRDRDREFTLRGSESRTVATVGTFRVVSSRDLRDHQDRPLDTRSGDLRHLREQGLVQTVRLPGTREHAVALTKEGRYLLESHRDRDRSPHQTFWDGVRRERELEHDVQVYRAYEREADALLERGARIERVILDYELKREYQKWLHERDRDRDDYDGHPDRTADEIQDWAYEHELPYFDDQVHFPDVRIEYAEPDGRWDHLDVEVTTEHYRGAHGASVARSGFSCYRGSSLRIGGRSGGGRGGGGRHGGLAEELLS